MFEIDGKQYSVDDLQKAAVKYGMDYNAYLSKMMEKGLKEIKPAKTEAVTTETAPVTAENQAVGTDLVSENGLLDLQKPKPVTEEQALFNYKQRTGEDAVSVMDLTDEDYEPNAFLKDFFS